MKIVVFHESGREFTWSPADRTVRTANGLIVARDCYNLSQARLAVQKWR